MTKKVAEAAAALRAGIASNAPSGMKLVGAAALAAAGKAAQAAPAANTKAMLDAKAAKLAMLAAADEDRAQKDSEADDAQQDGGAQAIAMIDDGMSGGAGDSAATLIAAPQAAEGGAAKDGGKESDKDDDKGGIGTVPLVLGGLALVGGGIALAAGGGKKNEPPVVSPTQSVTTAEDTKATITVSATDPNGDTLTYSNSAPSKGTVTASGNSFVYQPNKDYNGTDSFTVTVSDGRGGTVSQTVNITVTPVNDAPTVAATQTVAATEDAKSVAFTVTGSDVDTGDVLSYSAPAKSSQGGTVTGGANGAFTYVPLPDFNGNDTVVVTVTDKAGATATQTVTFAVAANKEETRSIDVTNDTTATTYDANGTAAVPNVSGSTIGDNFKYTDDSTKPTNARIINFTKGDTIEVTGSSTDYSFTTQGTDLFITYNNSAAGVLNQIVVPGVASGFINDEASAESVLGWDFFNALTKPNGGPTGTPGAGGNLDIDNDGSLATTAIVSAAGANIAFTEDANVANNVRVTGFGTGDTITVSNAAANTYSFTSVGADLVITANKAGVASQIVLASVVPANAFVNSEASAEAALGFDFFRLATVTPPSGGGTPTTSQSIDNGTTLATLSAANGGINFTDDATKETNVVITSFTNDDRITVIGANQGQYSFSTGTDPNDLVITFNNNSAGVVNSIVLDNVLVGKSDFIIDYASARNALGFDFMVFA